MSLEVLWPLGLTALLLIGAISDIRARRLPNWLALALLVYGLAHGFMLDGLSGLGWHAAHSAVALLVGMGLFAIGAFGGGDAKFYAGMAAYFPLQSGINLLLWVTLLGGLFILIWMVGRRVPVGTRAKEQSGLKGKFPYGVAITSGGIGAAWTAVMLAPALLGMQL